MKLSVSITLRGVDCEANTKKNNKIRMKAENQIFRFRLLFLLSNAKIKRLFVKSAFRIMVCAENSGPLRKVKFTIVASFEVSDRQNFRKQFAFEMLFLLTVNQP